MTTALSIWAFCNKDVSRSLLRGLHPTPAVCGDSPADSLDFIRRHEAVEFDRGYFAGPFGYIGADSADVAVAIRSALLTNYDPPSTTGTGADRYLRRGRDPSAAESGEEDERTSSGPEAKASVFGGAGIVDGSTVQSEWTEISHKMGVMSSLFPQSPITLQSQSTPNAAWSTAFVEELVRCGVTQFYICPGSRNTPLTAAVYRSTRVNAGIVRAVSVHDERGAGFRAVGYARGTGRCAAVVTSSGTAVANLYPAVVEAGQDGVPLLVITADRPYESRDTGANQSIDQVKIFSGSYVRWFRDVPPPGDDVPVSLALSDANHAVALTSRLRGPVHLNVQFRENLAPDDGPIRNDGRVGSVTRFHNRRFTDVPAFSRWSRGGGRWQDAPDPSAASELTVMEVAELISRSRRGIIVAGNLRTRSGTSSDTLASTVAHFAQEVGFPVFAGVQSGPLRRELPVIPYAEHLLKNPLVSNGIRPDLVLQLGAPLVSTEILSVIRTNPAFGHVLVQDLYPHERADPDQTVTLRVNSDIGSFVRDLTDHIVMSGMSTSSELAPLVYLGRELGKGMPSIISEASSGSGEDDDVLTEPQVMRAISEVLAEGNSTQQTLFLSNSMPVRDGEFFLYPPRSGPSSTTANSFPRSVHVNRGASGIDGIISTATGVTDSSQPATLVCGDVTTIHDLNSFYGLTQDDAASPANGARPPLTTVVVNNGGGAIFSVLPIARHGQDVGFEALWGTPTSNFSFERGMSAFGLPYESASSSESFKAAYRSSIGRGGPSVVEARVVRRSDNVDVHKEITRGAVSLIDAALGPPAARDGVLPLKRYGGGEQKSDGSKTLLLLHGWMGDKSEWDEVGESLSVDISDEWNVVSLDLPGHGESSLILATDQQAAHSALGLDAMQPFGPTEESPFALDTMARAVCRSLIEDHGIDRLDAIAGYSLGGRVALAMKALYASNSDQRSGLVSDETHLVLLGANPGRLPSVTEDGVDDDEDRLAKDSNLAMKLFASADRSCIIPRQLDEGHLNRFVSSWYSAPIWGGLQNRRPDRYRDMIKKRVSNLMRRRRDIASVLYGCSPPLSSHDNYKAANPARTTFVSGELDSKYSAIGRKWEGLKGIAKHVEVSNAGHSLLVEAPDQISSIIARVVNDEEIKEIATGLPVQAESEVVVELESQSSPLTAIGMFQYESFSISLESGEEKAKGVRGIGWGDSARVDNELKRREGYIISLASKDGKAVGVGEVSPLAGLHGESFEEAGSQLEAVQAFLLSADESDLPQVDAKRILALDGTLGFCVDEILVRSGLSGSSDTTSVRSGLEQAMLSVAAQIEGFPLPQALVANHRSSKRLALQQPLARLPLNGLVTRGSTIGVDSKILFPSVKIKVGHSDQHEDSNAVVQMKKGLASAVRLRCDANRAWDMSTYRSFVNELMLKDVLRFVEFIEEPLQKQVVGDEWLFSRQITALEDSSKDVSYALDESLADLAQQHSHDFNLIARDLKAAFGGRNKGSTKCAAFVLKPALLGLELSSRIAELAQSELGISAVFSSSFDSGIGLAYAGIVAATSDKLAVVTNTPRFPHGLGTFSLLGGDTLSPSFESYVSKDGFLNVASLSRALYGLSLEEISDRLLTHEAEQYFDEPSVTSTESESYLATTSSTSGRDITVSVALPLPFSDSIASSRFTDLPQMSRWSPWLNSVTYLDESGLTEWTLNIRGVRFSWRAKSEVITEPRGIRWESVSGLKNEGLVEFEPVTNDSCMMKLQMSIIMPYIMVSLFQGMPSVVQEFLQNKLLKWSLEMFRDVVKADLALERGDNELGDALFGAVEGRANALEEALSK